MATDLEAVAALRRLVADIDGLIAGTDGDVYAQLFNTSDNCEECYRGCPQQRPSTCAYHQAKAVLAAIDEKGAG